MADLVNDIVGRICSGDPKYAPTLRAHLSKMDGVFHDRAESFFGKYDKYLNSQGKTIDFGIDCFNVLRANVQQERVKFLRTGRYANESFDAVNRTVYGNPDIMQSYMHGLVFAQFLWPEQYRRFGFFCENLGRYTALIKSYLEVGGGHGLYISEAARVLDRCSRFDLVDISPSSLEIAKGIAGESTAAYHLRDVFAFPEDRAYDFVTMGEVLEHVERPTELLRKVHRLLTPNGHAYITTPANAPMIDHIYLFRSADEIRTMLSECGFTIEHEVTQYAADLPAARCIALKAPLMFGAFVRRT